MKKLLTSLCLSSIFGVIPVMALDVTSGTDLIADTTSDPSNNLVFKAGEDGKSYVYSSKKSGQIRNLVMSGSAYVGSITVEEGVEGIMNFSTIDFPYKSGGDIAFRFGGSNNTVNGSALISGAGKDLSIFSFYGSRFDTGHIHDSNAAARASDTMTIKNITFNFNSTTASDNWIGSNNMVLDNAVLNVNSGRLRSSYIKTLTLTNSTLNVNTTTNPDNIVSGATVDFNGTSIIKGSGSIKFGAYNSGKELSKVATIYAYANTMSFGGITSDVITNNVYFGEDENGETHDVNLSIYNIQVNQGEFSIKAKNSSIVNITQNLNLAAEQEAYIGKGVDLTAAASRIRVGTIDGKITLNGGYVNANGWNYTLGLGVLGNASHNTQVANITIGKNAEINVIGSSSSAGKNFTMTGSVVSNAGIGKIVSDSNGGFLIRSNKYDSSHVSVLTLNTTDAFAVGGASSQADSTFFLDMGAKVKIVANAENTIGSIDFASGAVLTLDLALANAQEGDTLWIKDFSGNVSDITLDNFANNKLRVGVDVVSDAMKTLSFIVNGEIWTFGNEYDFVAASNGGFYINAIAVPEPAEWAMIFGAIALGFIAYRRRK